MSDDRATASYRDAGVDYDSLDAGKRLAIAKALSTSGLLAARGGRALDASRGEPAFVFELDDRAFAFVVEGLGTKSVIARQVLEQQGINRFAAVAYDTVAAILNDLCCVGALPLVVNAYFATGASDWYRDADRAGALLDGWREACADAGCTWGGGESPSLPGLVDERDIELAGAAVGVVPSGRSPILGDELGPGDEIVLVASSGLHANGASLARLVAARLPEGYATPLASGATLGEALLAPSVMYAPLIAAALERDLPLTYISHVTGHGLLKLMRPPKPLSYRIERLPEVPEVLAFLAERAGLDAHAAYSTFNMGSGYALYCPAGKGAAIVELATELGFTALVAGRVEQGPRQVVIEPAGVRFEDAELELSAG
ncbi:MAG: phosphoribosylformylglycinamidine cyclo-ligase [Gaiellales bacterium]|nr:phosphoribosylformylglycinamidine cyclo-ligase [Gaiellales bacterium]